MSDQQNMPLRGGSKIMGLDQRVFVVGFAMLGTLGLLLLVLAVLFMPPFNLATRLGGYKTLSAQNPTISHPDGITVTWQAGENLRLRLASVPREAFLQGEADRSFPGARAALPSYLEMKSPFYILDPQSSSQTSIEIVIPNDAQAYQTLDLYRWDRQTGAWVFVPGHVDVAAGVIRTDELPDNVAVFQAKAVTSLIGTMLTEGQVLDPAVVSGLNFIMLAGLTLQPDGTLQGTPASGWPQGAGYAVIPAVGCADATALSSLLNNPASLALHVQDLAAVAVNGGYNGIAINCGAINTADRALFSQYISDLAEALHASNKVLVVVVSRPTGNPGAWDTGGYDWRAIGATADALIVFPSPQPSDYGINGLAMDLLGWAVGEVSRYKLYLASMSLSYDETLVNSMRYEDALSKLGGIMLESPSPDDSAEAADPLVFEPGTELAFRLNSSLTEVVADQNSGAYVFTVLDEHGEHRIWIVTANTIRARLDMAANYHIGGMVLYGLGSPGNPPGLATAINEFKARAASTIPSQLTLQWTVSDASGALLTESTGLGTPWVWRADTEGEYSVSAAIIGVQPFGRGSVDVQIGQIEPTPTPTPTPTTPPPPRRTSPPPTAAPGSTPVPTTPPPPPPPPQGGAGGDGGAFALGGQVPGFIAHPDIMRSAGMTWVKFQIVWQPGADPAAASGLISAGKSSGFKVLLSIKGPLYPASIDFGAYTDYVKAVAAYQPDAIEVWNEMNLNREWPTGQIDPANYVNNMLAPAFNAIKSVSPGTMVIIGALAPTGVDDGVNVWSDQRYVQGLAAAGAARYANCIGVHHNAGATPPSASTGHPGGGHYSWYFKPTIDVYYGGIGGALPVCFTEYGYVSPEGYGALPANFAWGADNTVAEQAAWLAEGVQIARSLGYVRLMIVWNVDFTYWASDDPQAGYAIVRPDGSCPACSTLANAMH